MLRICSYFNFVLRMCAFGLILICSVNSQWTGVSVVRSWSVGLLLFPQRAGGDTFILLSEHLLHERGACIRNWPIMKRIGPSATNTTTQEEHSDSWNDTTMSKNIKYAWVLLFLFFFDTHKNIHYNIYIIYKLLSIFLKHTHTFTILPLTSYLNPSKISLHRVNFVVFFVFLQLCIFDYMKSLLYFQHK